MRIITLNLWGHGGPWRARQTVARQELQALAPDVLCLQEVLDRDLLLEFEQALGLSTLVSDLEVSHLAILGRERPRSTCVHTLGVQSPYPDDTLRRVLLLQTPDHCIATTHLAWRPDDAATRAGQVLELARLLGGPSQTPSLGSSHESHSKPLPTLLCGDFNCTPSDPELQALWNIGFADALAGHPAATRPTWDNTNPYTLPYRDTTPDSRLDLVLCNTPWLQRHPLEAAHIVLDQPIDGVYPSDHFGVLVEFAP